MKRALVNGTLAGAGLVVYGYLYRALALESIPGAIWLFYAVVSGVAILTAWQARGQAITWYVTISSAVAAGIIAALIYAIYVFGYNQYVDDSLLVTLKQSYQSTWQAEGVSPTEISERLESPSFTPAGFALQVFIMMSVLALGTGSVSGPLVRKLAR